MGTSSLRRAAQLRKLRPDLVMPEAEQEEMDIHLAHCPERVLPGSVLRELVDNDRIIGGISQHCAELAAELGAWAVGFILWPGSKRYADPGVAAGIVRAVRRRVESVGVFVNQPRSPLPCCTSCRRIMKNENDVKIGTTHRSR